MFKFSPAVSIETIKKHTDEVKRKRITLTNGSDIFEYFFEEEAEKYIELQKQEVELATEGITIWNLVENNLISTLNFFRTYAYPYMEELEQLVLNGILNYNMVNIDFRRYILTSVIPKIHSANIKASSLEKAAEDFATYCMEICNDYLYCNSNVLTSNDLVLINNCKAPIIIPKDGKIGSYCVAILPQTERALSLFLTFTSFSDSTRIFPKLWKSGILCEDEGNPLTITPIQELI